MEMSSTINILEIAPEVLIKILKNLYFIDILSCARTCQTILGIVQNSLELNYHMQLQIAGLQDNPSCVLPLSDRLIRLKERERRWNSFDWKSTSIFPVPHDTSNLFEISPSTLVMGIAQDEGRPGTKGLQTARLGTQSGNPEENNDIISMLWKDFAFGADILEIGVAIEEHDLIACIVSIPDTEETTYTVSNILVYLVRYTTARWYDDCKETILPLCRIREEVEGTPKFTIEISGENLAITMVLNGRSREHERTLEDNMYIFDWKAGKNKTPNGMPIICAGAAFLQENIIARPDNLRKSIDLYHVPSSEDFSRHNRSRVRLIRQLLLPEAPFEWFITSFEVRSSPNPTSASTCPEFIPRDKPFTNDPAQAIVFFFMDIYHVGTRDIRSFVLFTHRKALLDLVPWEREAPDFIDGHFSCDELAWEKWGPPVTRWFSEGQYTSAQVTTTAGQRYAMTVHSIAPSDGPAPLRRIHLINFNPWTVKMVHHGLLEGLEAIGGNRKDLEGNELEENTCSGSDVFYSNIVGRLPYVRPTKSIDWPHPAAMMNEEMLLGLILKPGTRHLECVSTTYFG